MDKEHVKGAAEQAIGKIKEIAGRAVGDRELEADGKVDQAKGAAHKVAGDVKDASRDAAASVRNATTDKY